LPASQLLQLTKEREGAGNHNWLTLATAGEYRMAASRIELCPGVERSRVTKEREGRSYPSTVQRISRPFAGCSLEAVDPVKRFGADKHERLRHVV
jgi:hypothetical protein